MADPKLRGFATAGLTVNATSLSIAKSSFSVQPQAGDYIVIIFAADAQQTFSVPGGSPLSILGQITDGGNAHSSCVATCISGAETSYSIQWSLSERCVAVAAAFYDTDGLDVFSTTPVRQGGISITTPTVTTTVAETRLVTMTSSDTVVTSPDPSIGTAGHTKVGHRVESSAATAVMALADAVQASAGTSDAVVHTYPATDTMIAWALALKPSAAVNISQSVPSLTTTPSLGTIALAVEPINTAAPTVSPFHAKESEVVTATTGTWTGYPLNYEYKWEVENPVPVNTVLPSVPTEATEGVQLSATTGTWTGADTYEYQWSTEDLDVYIPITPLTASPAIGSASIVNGPYFIELIGLTSVNSFGTIGTVQGPVSRTLTGLNSSASIGSLNVANAASQNITLTPLVGTVSIGSSQVLPGVLEVFLVGRSSTLSIGALSLQAPPINIAPPTLVSPQPYTGSAFNANAGQWQNHNTLERRWELEAVISVTSIGPTSSIGTPGTVTTPPGIAYLTSLIATPTIGTLSQVLGVYPIPVSAIGSSASIGTISVGIDAVNTVPPVLNSPQPYVGQIYSATAGTWSNAQSYQRQWEYEDVIQLRSLASTPSIGAVGTSVAALILLNPVLNTNNFGLLNFTKGTVSRTLSSLIGTPSIGSLALSTGAVSRTLTGLASTASIGTPALIGLSQFSLSSLTSTPAIGSPSVIGISFVVPSSLTNGTSFGIPSTSAELEFGLSSINSNSSIGNLTAYPPPTNTVLPTLTDPTPIVGNAYGANPGVWQNYTVIERRWQLELALAEITLSSLNSSPSIGTVQSSSQTNIVLNSLVSVGSIGNLTLIPGPRQIAPVSLSSSANIGSLNLQPGPVAVTPSGLTGTPSIGVANAVPGSVTIPLTGIVSTASIGNPIVGSDLIINPGSLVGTATIGLLYVENYLQIITLESVTRPFVIGSLALNPGEVEAAITSLLSTATLGSLSIDVGEIEINPISLSNTSIIGSLEASGFNNIELVSIESTAIISSIIFETEIARTVESLNSINTFGIIGLSSVYSVAINSLLSNITFGSVALSDGYLLALDSLTSINEFGLIDWSTYVTFDLPTLVNTGSFGVLSVDAFAPSDQTIELNSLTSTASVGSLESENLNIITLNSIVNITSIGSLQPFSQPVGPQTLILPFLQNTSSFGTPSPSNTTPPPGQSVELQSINSTATIGNVSVILIVIEDTLVASIFRDGQWRPAEMLVYKDNSWVPVKIEPAITT